MRRLEVPYPHITIYFIQICARSLGTKTEGFTSAFFLQVSSFFSFSFVSSSLSQLAVAFLVDTILREHALTRNFSLLFHICETILHYPMLRLYRSGTLGNRYESFEASEYVIQLPNQCACSAAR